LRSSEKTELSSRCF